MVVGSNPVVVTKIEKYQNYNKNKKKNKKQKKTKIRRLKEIKNILKDLKVFVSGLKSKTDALVKAIDDHKPNIICSVETQLAKEEQIEIPGYGI